MRTVGLLDEGLARISRGRGAVGRQALAACQVIEANVLPIDADRAVGKDGILLV
jgi:hypothetical protein